ncbi:MAG: hypothetical protein ACRERD_15950 [Candidatus Binatia bacterium]
MFQLTKIWIDQDPGLETVEIRYTWSPLGEPARWEGEEEAEIMAVVPNTSPQIRQAILEIPRSLNGKDSYQLHYRFGGGGEHKKELAQIFTEEIIAREIPYLDTEGRITEVRLLWSVDGWSAPNWTQAKLAGLNLHTGPDVEGEGIADDAIYELIQTVPLPRRYVGKVWGPRGATVEYCYQLLRTNSPLPEDDFQAWDNSQSENYRLVLD